ncbi:hypothetical protein CYMTET_15471 [Cymbomonas tetramitiformis]|uniref:Uncharacterized protein n=1 Tax=Cymbomonas tetramitiformis TaxID=36881 RepID=A0AAE0L995_9CHLO|nr:hypothetical protein CYMTET_15471 [Cymbomonas tetramitiformis]
MAQFFDTSQGFDVQSTYDKCVSEGGRSAGNCKPCDCEEANPSTLVNTNEDAAVCFVCGVVVDGLVLYYPVNRHEKVQIKLEELKNDPTATLDAPQTYDKRLICVRDAWIEFIQNDSTGISFDAAKDFPKLIKLVYDGDFNNKILLNDMLHLCKTYLVGMPHVLAKLVVLRKAAKPRKGPKKGKRTLVA